MRKNYTKPPRRARRGHSCVELLERRIVLATLTVTNVLDSGPGSLRQAILDANDEVLYPGKDTVAFGLSGGGPYSIKPLSPLPTITAPLIIDGYTQSGATPNTLADGDNAVLMIELEGSGAGIGVTGLRIAAPESVVRGLVINRFQGEGIAIEAAGGKVVVEGNFIGTDVTGRFERRSGFGRNGVLISDSKDNRIGGDTPEARNVISGNNSDAVEISGPASTGNKVLGNFIGTSATGTLGIGNFGVGVLIANASGNEVGGATPGARNVIAGDVLGIDSDGVSITASAASPATGNIVQGNFIGLDVHGAPLGNAGHGVVIRGDAPGNAILANRIANNRALGINLGPDLVTANDPADVDPGPNNLQNFPVLTSANIANGNATIAGTLNSASGTAFRLDFYANSAADPSGYGEGARHLGFENIQIPPGANDVSFARTLAGTSLAVGEFVTATASTLDSALKPTDTSEFSAALQAVTDSTHAVADAATTRPGVPVTIAVLANDTDPQNQTLTLSSVSVPGRGTAAISDGKVIYTPVAGFVGFDSFTYTVADTDGNTARALVHVRVSQETVGSQFIENFSDDFDLAVPAYDSWDHDPLTVPGGDTDPDPNTRLGPDIFPIPHSDGPKIRFERNRFGNTTPFLLIGGGLNPDTYVIDFASVPFEHGGLEPSAEVVTVGFRYRGMGRIVVEGDIGTKTLNVPNSSNWAGLAVVSNDPSDTGGEVGAIKRVRFTPLEDQLLLDDISILIFDAGFSNNPPAAVDDGAVARAGAFRDIDVLANDGDLDNDALTVSNVSPPGHGTAVKQGTSIRYTPVPGFVGSDTFTYTVSDGRGGTDTASVTVSVEVPMAVADTAFTLPDRPVDIDVLSNDTSPGGNFPLTITGASDPPNGSVAIHDSLITYTPDAGAHGVDNFTYTLRDDFGNTSTGNVGVVVNTQPVAIDRAFSVPHGSVGPFNVPAPGLLAGASDPDNDPVQAVTGEQLVNGGTVTIRADGSFTFTPSIAGGHVLSTTFTYTLVDSFGAPAAAEARLVVTNTAPEALFPLAFPLREAGAFPFEGVLGTDADGDHLSVELIDQPQHGLLTFTQSPPDALGRTSMRFRYDALPDGIFRFNEKIRFRLSDAPYGATSELGMIEIRTNNRAPVALDDEYFVGADQIPIPIRPHVVANDTDADGDPLFPILVSGPAHGTLTRRPIDGLFQYVPEENFVGIDSFTYRASDTDLQSEVATVRLRVEPGPLALDDFIEGDYEPVEERDIPDLFLDIDHEGWLDIPFSHLMGNDLYTDTPDNEFGIILDTAFIRGGRLEWMGYSNGMAQFPTSDGLGPRYRFIYRHGFSGRTSFTYQLRNSLDVRSNVAEVTIAINDTDEDGDGVLGSVEDDYNGAESKDRLPSRDPSLASLPTLPAPSARWPTRSYRLELHTDGFFRNVRREPGPDLPGLKFPFGVFRYEIHDHHNEFMSFIRVYDGYLPVNMSEFFNFGPTADVVNPDGSHPSHWYMFDKQPTGPGPWDYTGAHDFDYGDGLLAYEDGERGDNDMTQNGVISAVGGPVLRVPIFEQSNVATLMTPYGDSVKFESPPGTRFTAISSIRDDRDAQLGGGFFGWNSLPWGFFEFALEGVPVGGTVDVEMTFDRQFPVYTFYKKGFTPNSPTERKWYEFLSGGSPGSLGATLFDDDNDGNINRVVLRLQDGALGDDDVTANGVIVDPGGPAVRFVTAAAFEYAEAPHRLTLTFDAAMRPSLSPAHLLLTNLTTGAFIDPSAMAVDYDRGTSTATFRFPGLPGGILPDGNYRATLNGGSVHDVLGNVVRTDFVIDFFVLAADANRDRKIDFADLVVLAQNYGRSGRTFSNGDFNLDGRVGFEDLVILAQRYNTTLPTPDGASGIAVSTAALGAVILELPGSHVTQDNPRPRPVPKPKIALNAPALNQQAAMGTKASLSRPSQAPPAFSTVPIRPAPPLSKAKRSRKPLLA